MNQVALFPILVVLSAAAVAAVTDLWKFKVYNWLTLPLMTSGLLYHASVGGLPGLGASVGALLFSFGALILLYALRGMGAGDVKLMAGIGAWLGVPAIHSVFLTTALAAGICSTALLAWRHLRDRLRSPGLTSRRHLSAKRMYAALFGIHAMATLGWPGLVGISARYQGEGGPAAANGRASGKDSNRLATLLERPDRRLRVIPFAAMVFVGTVASLFWEP